MLSGPKWQPVNCGSHRAVVQQHSGRPARLFIDTHATQRFTDRIAPRGLTPPDIGVLRMIAMSPGRSQRSLAEELGVVPSRVVALLDNLDRKGLVERRRSTTDRRNHELHPTPAAYQLMGELWPVLQSHEADLTAALSPAERDQLASLLVRVAEQQGLDVGIHAGYQRAITSDETSA
ncbi:MarR family winged helix-turn-helix transcriptional regulator [Nocardia asiatica]|uniref:MarR family winged helix-turn-helix transcriptional regulator n=1 Tax=Nocardia asiatica TaxID=209252 RepID=UPI000308C040|nr:MarR family winged helix-turn-helix transcriptional regulator [Nocardia asiatica]